MGGRLLIVVNNDSLRSRKGSVLIKIKTMTLKFSFAVIVIIGNYQALGQVQHFHCYVYSSSFCNFIDEEQDLAIKGNFHV